MSFNRREFLKLSLVSLAVGVVPMPALAAITQGKTNQRQLAFYNTHTGEKLDICYFYKGGYCPDALARIFRILRDHRTREVQPIDTDLLDMLYAVKSRIGPKTPFHIISGYRSPTTNEQLRKQSNGVARKSYHTKGQAIDIRLPGYDTRRLRDCCVALKAGGVGYYAGSNFVHLDTGPVRSW